MNTIKFLNTQPREIFEDHEEGNNANCILAFYR